MEMRENVILGLDIGIGSIGWALVEENPDTLEKRPLSRVFADGGTLDAWGVRAFNVPENHKKELLNAHRRNKRMQRRVIARRARRMRRIRILLAAQGLPVEDRAALSRLDPWRLRVKGLEVRLEPLEWACVLAHMAKHRGFKSNSKRDRAADAAPDSQKMLSAVGSLAEKVRASQYTIGAYMAMAGDMPLRNRKNALGEASYAATPLRDLVEEEAAVLFARQRDYGNPAADEKLCRQYSELAFTQNALKPVTDLIGKCLFLNEEKRAPKYAPTAERFRLAQRLTTLRLGEEEAPLAPERIRAALDRLGSNKGLTYVALRRLLCIEPSKRFAGLSYGARDERGREINPEAADIAARTTGCGPGSYALCKALGEEAFARLYDARMESGTGDGPRCLDYVAKVLSENDDIAAIEKEFHNPALALREAERAALLAGLRNGAFAAFKGAMRLSLKAMERILPHMIAKGSYALGCEEAGFDHSRMPPLDVKSIANPVAARIFREVKRQCENIMETFGCIPGRVHIELLRGVGKSKDERSRIAKGLERRASERSAARSRLAELLRVPEDSLRSAEILRYELWRAQQGKCAYFMLWGGCGGERHYAGPTAQGAIPVEWLREGGEPMVQIDHILPYSRTFDNSFHNLCLCLPSANQAKGSGTPWEWLGKHNAEAWHAHEEWVKSLPVKGLKKRNFCLKNLDKEAEERFHARNLTDSAYVARLMQQWWHEYYAGNDVPMRHEDGRDKRRVFARPGGVTAWLRHEWGVERLKKSEEGQRQGDRHHALDALVTACCSEGLLRRVTGVIQRRETCMERARIPDPWPGFAADVAARIRGVFVSRAEKGRAKGALHEDTLRGIRQETVDGASVKKLYVRKAVHKLGPADLENIVGWSRLREDVRAGLERWASLGKGARRDEANLPKDAQGKIIRRVRVCEPFRSGVELWRGGARAQADNGGIVRTDVFSRNGKFYLVPVYTWHVAKKILPNKAVATNKPEEQWPEMDPAEGYVFRFSLIPNSYVATEKGGVVKEGYFLGMDRATGAIALAAPHDRQKKTTGIGVRGLDRFEKYRVDRMGRLFRVRGETRPGPDGHNPVEDV